MVCCASHAAAPGDNPYRTIIRQNSFGLLPQPSAAVQNFQTPPPEITLTGIMSAFNDRRAIFKVRELSGVEKSIILAEGERIGEIELTSVDIKAGTITVNNHGIIQTIAISKMPVFQLAGTAAASGSLNLAANNKPVISGEPNQTAAVTSQNANTLPDASQSGGFQFGWGGAKNPSSPGNGAAASGGQDSNLANSPGANAGDSNSGKPKPDAWWIHGSKMIEQARLDSAEAVLNGTADPQPLTPLTPPGTPAYLIGPGQLFFEHM